MMKKSYYVYIVTNRKNGTIYTGVTNDIRRRMYEHKNKIKEGFTSRYNLNKLVYFDETDDISTALTMEKKIKGWLRRKKIALIEEMNPGWEDLSKDWF